MRSSTITVTVWALLLRVPCLSPAPCPQAPGGRGDPGITAGGGGAGTSWGSAESHSGSGRPPNAPDATPFSEMSSSDLLLLRERRSSLTRRPPELSLQVQTGPEPSQTLGVDFHKCAQLVPDSDPPLLSIFLLIHHSDPAHGSKLVQVTVLDSITGLALVRSEGREVEAGFQSFNVESMHAGSRVLLNYSAHVRSLKSHVLELPAFLTFSNASQNDVNMLGPLTANLTLRGNFTVRIHPNHTLHFAGFVAAFFISLVLGLLAFLLLNWINPNSSLRLCHKQRRGSELEFGSSDVSTGLTNKAEFEFDKMVDIMTLEAPQNMDQALDSLQMSTLLLASHRLEEARLHIHKDLVVVMLSRDGSSHGRLVEVIHSQLMALEGRLKEEHEDRTEKLTKQRNNKTRDALKSLDLKEKEEEEEKERLCLNTQTGLHCGQLLEKLHTLNRTSLQRHLQLRQEEATAQVQRKISELRRVELHQIFCEELEEATRSGEMNQRTASALQHEYFNYQADLEQVLDEVVAHHRFLVSERQVHRRFLVQSLQRVHCLMSEIFSSVRRSGRAPAELQYDRGQQEALLQRLEEAVQREKKDLRCELLQKRRERLCDMWRLHKRQQNSLSSSLSMDEEPFSSGGSVLQLLHSWRNLLVSQSREESELIKHLDEEAAELIRKVISDLLQDTTAERPLQAEHALLQTEGRSTTTDALQEALQSELTEQRDSRGQCRAFFRRLVTSQLALSDSDLLKMKLEFHKCFTVMDLCLVLPPAVLRAKLHCALDEWRRSQEKLWTGAVAKENLEVESELRRFQKNLQERLKLFERSHKMENELREKVQHQMCLERQNLLLSQSDSLCSQLVSLHLEKVQMQSRALRTCAAMLSLQSLLIPELRGKCDMSACVRAHVEGLSAAEQQFQRDISRLNHTSELTDLRPLLETHTHCRMDSILQGALYKREQLLSLLTQSSEETTNGNQTRENRREHLKLRRLQELCAQELQLTSALLKLVEVPGDVLMEMLHLLLPLSESELLSVYDALRPKDLPTDPSASSALKRLVVKLREDVIREASLKAPVCTGETENRLQEKRRGLLEKLLPSTCAPPPSAAPLILVQAGSGPEAAGSGPEAAGSGPESGPEAAGSGPEAEPKIFLVKLAPDEFMSLSPSPGPDPGPSPDPGSDADGAPDRLFIFRDSLFCAQTPEGTTRKRKRNFLNLKKGSVEPSDLLL